MNKNLIIQKAKQKAAALAKLRKDPRYTNVIGRLKGDGLLIATKVPANRMHLFLNDILWVGEKLEPRVLELLPAIVLKRPGIINEREYPEDLKEAVRKLRNGETQGDFRGMPLKKCAEWLEFVGRKNRRPTVLKSFRLTYDDLKLLQALGNKLNWSNTDLIREGLRKLNESLG